MKGKGAIATILAQAGPEGRQCPLICISIKHTEAPLSHPSYSLCSRVLSAVGPHAAARRKAWQQGLGVAFAAGPHPKTSQSHHFAFKPFRALTSSLWHSCLQQACALPAFQSSWNTRANMQAQTKLSHFKWVCPTGRSQQDKNIHETPPNSHVGVIFGGKEGKQKRSTHL